MTEDFVYVGRDLEAMSFARNYHLWILDLFQPYLGSRLVEVGAGTGSFSELLIECRPDSLMLVEPSAMFEQLLKRVANSQAATLLETVQGTFADAVALLRDKPAPDSVIYINVLEHIEDDETELAMIREALAPGGRVFLFVPAFNWLYGSFDKLVGHRRRYTSGELQRKCEAAGLRVVKAAYFDFAGILPWWIKYRLLRSPNMEPAAVRFYDSFCVPVLRRIEGVVSPPFGKNLLMIAEKS